MACFYPRHGIEENHLGRRERCERVPKVGIEIPFFFEHLAKSRGLFTQIRPFTGPFGTNSGCSGSVGNSTGSSCAMVRADFSITLKSERRYSGTFGSIRNLNLFFPVGDVDIEQEFDRRGSSDFFRKLLCQIGVKNRVVMQVISRKTLVPARNPVAGFIQYLLNGVKITRSPVVVPGRTHR